MAPCQLTVRPRPRLRDRAVSVVIAFDHVHDEQRRVCHSSFVSLSLSLSISLSFSCSFSHSRSAFRPYRYVGVLNCNSSWVSWKAAALAHTHLPHLGFRYRYRFRFSCVANSHSCFFFFFFYLSYTSFFAFFSNSVAIFGANLISRSINAFRKPFTITTTAQTAPSLSLPLFLSLSVSFFVPHAVSFGIFHYILQSVISLRPHSVPLPVSLPVPCLVSLSVPLSIPFVVLCSVYKTLIIFTAD